MKSYFKIFILIIFLFSCSKKLVHIQGASSTLLLSMERTACYGTCPQYIISIYNNGLIKYEGQMFVEKIGCFYSTLSEDVVKDIKFALNDVQFFEFKNIYTATVTDVPSVILEVNLSSKNHKVIDRFNGPEELKKLQKFVDLISDRVEKWNLCDVVE